MLLSKITYSQFKDEARQWTLSEVDFQQINLLVGKNASGKTKTIAIINSLSMMLSDYIKLPFIDGAYTANFKKENNEYQYELAYKDNKVIKENLFFDSFGLLHRDENGGGDIMTYSGHASNHGDFREFKIPSDELKANRRDEIQYPFLEDLNFWARHVRRFDFSSLLGKNQLQLLQKSQQIESPWKLKDTEKVAATFTEGLEKHGKTFTDKVIKDFNSIGYSITEVSLGPLVSVVYKTDNPNFELVGLRVKEIGLSCMTDQNDMSNGMYRALSIIIHFTFYELEEIPGTVLIDDIGEGLDYDRSTNLIKLLIDKIESKAVDVQLIMATNDRFVMNCIDLKYWQIIDRDGGNVRYNNIRNSRKIFEDFRFTGLNNFDFFSSEFFRKGFDAEQ